MHAINLKNEAESMDKKEPVKVEITKKTSVK